MLPSPYSFTDGTTTHSINKVNQDNYGSVYRLRESDGTEHEVSLIRREVTPGRGRSYDKHSIRFMTTRYDSEGLEDRKSTCLISLDVPKGAPSDDAVFALKALSEFFDTNSAAIVDWQA